MYTKSELIDFEHHWTIDSFSSSFFPFNNSFHSPANEQLIFRVSLFINENGQASLMLDLDTCESDESNNVTVNWKVSVLDKAAQKTNTKECTIMSCDGIKSWSPLMPFDNIIESFNDFVTDDDQLHFHFEISYFANSVNVNEEVQDRKVGKLCRQFERKAMENWTNLLKNEMYCDVVISLNDGDRVRELKAHRAILASQSIVFSAMFTTDMEEKRRSRVHITDLTKVGVFEQFLAFLYSGKVESIKLYVVDLLVLADKYAVESLRTFCSQYLTINLCLQSCVSVMIHADMYNATELKSSAIKYIVSNISEVIETADWNNMITAWPELFNEIFRQVVNNAH